MKVGHRWRKSAYWRKARRPLAAKRSHISLSIASETPESEFEYRFTRLGQYLTAPILLAGVVRGL